MTDNVKITKEKLEKFDIFLSPKTSTKASDELFYVYRAMSSPEEKLVLLYHSFGFSGEKAFPSMAIARVNKLFKSAKEEKYSELPIEKTVFSPEFAREILHFMPNTPYGQSIKNYFNNSKNAKNAPISSTNEVCDFSENTSVAVFGSKITLSQSIIDKYSSCPFEYLCSTLFSINDNTRAEFDYDNFGTYVHYILENFVKKAVEDNKIGDKPDEKYIYDSVNSIADDYFKMVFSSGIIANSRLLHRFGRMRKLAVLVATNITKEFADSNFRPAFFELSIGKDKKGNFCLPSINFDLSTGKKVSIIGNVDRVDILHPENNSDNKDNNVYVRVVDYKTGKKDFKFGDIKSIQLPLYLFAICDEKQKEFKNEVKCPEDGKVLPAGAMYFSSHIKEVEISDSCPISSAKDMAEASFKRSGFLLNDENILFNMNRSLSKDMLCGIYKKKDKLVGNCFSSEKIHQMEDELKATVCDVAGKILGGQMSPLPTTEESNIHCEYCSMNWICRSAKKFKA